MAKLLVTWVRSDIGHPIDQRRTLKSLGLRRLNQSVEHDDSESVKGMIMKVKHLVKVEESGETE